MRTTAMRAAPLAAAVTLAAVVAAGCSTSGGTDAAETTSHTPAPAQQWEPSGATPAPSTTASPPPELPTRTVPSTPSTPDPTLAEVDRADPDAVAVAAVESWFAWLPVSDGGPLDAMARTASLLTADYRDATLAEAPVRGPGGDFAAWAAAGADTVEVAVKSQPNQGAVDTPGMRHLVFTITQTAKNGAQPVGTAKHVAYVIVREGPDGWAVSKIVKR